MKKRETKQIGKKSVRWDVSDELSEKWNIDVNILRKLIVKLQLFRFLECM